MPTPTALRVLAAALSLVPVAAFADVIAGPEVVIGEGTAHAFVETDAAGNAIRLGVALTDTAVATAGQGMTMTMIELPETARAAGYDHAMLDWNPHGHEPAHLFDVPHFDVHFYMIEASQVDAIDPAADGAAKRPVPTLLPANFVPPPEAQIVPKMGEHWIDVSDPTYSGKPFDAVLIYGTYDGAVIFVEPMVTQDALLSGASFGGEIAQPEEVARPVSLPSAWSVALDPETGLHTISIDDLKARTPQDGGESS